jgi:hypothetical protein
MPVLMAALHPGALSITSLVAIVNRFTPVGRIAQNLNDRALTPALGILPARRRLLFRQPFLNGMGTELFVDEPTIHLLHHRRLALFNQQLLRSGLDLA